MCRMFEIDGLHVECVRNLELCGIGLEFHVWQIPCMEFLECVE